MTDCTGLKPKEPCSVWLVTYSFIYSNKGWRTNGNVRVVATSIANAIAMVEKITPPEGGSDVKVHSATHQGSITLFDPECIGHQ